MEKTMKDLNLAEAFRFLLPGGVLWIYFFISRPRCAIHLLSSAGVLAGTLLILIPGGLIYLVYRSLLYNDLLKLIQDITRIDTHNYRTYLIREFNLERYEADLCFSEIKDRYLEDRYKGLGVYASAIHFLYISGILTLPFMIYHFVKANFFKGYLFLCGFILFSLAAYLADRYYEDRELAFLSKIPRHSVQLTVDRVLRYFQSVEVEQTSPETMSNNRD
jgi:hypothetical protein